MNDPYHVYMDLDVINSDYNATSKPPLRFEETRNTPFLPGDSADYFCSVVRFNIQTGNTLPVFIPRVQTGQSGVNKTIYQVAVMWDVGGDAITGQYNQFGYSNVYYSPEDTTAPPPASPTTAQDLSSTYYHVYNYQHFIHLVNQAIVSARSNLIANLNPASVTQFNQLYSQTIAPYVDFNPETNRAFITAEEKSYNSEGISSQASLKLLFNDRLYELFASLPFRLINHPNNVAALQSLSGRACPWYSIRFVNRYNNKFTQKVIDPTSIADPVNIISIEVLQAHQEMTSIALWNPVASIALASSMLPLVSTQKSVPRNLGTHV